MQAFSTNTIIVAIFLAAITSSAYSQLVEYGGECNATLPCATTNNLICQLEYAQFQQGTCICTEGRTYVNSNPRCLVKPGETCTAANNDCVPYSSCSNGRCTCDPNFDVTSNGESCRGGFEASCTPSSCNGELGLSCNSTTSGVCICPATSGLFWSARRQKCVLEVGRSCSLSNQDDDDCTENARCTGSTCVCAPEYISYLNNAGKSVCAPNYGTKCPTTSGEQCVSTLFMTCNTTQTCDCQNQHFYDTGVCRILPGGDCNYLNDNCGRGSSCHSKTAKCFCRGATQVLDNGWCRTLSNAYGGGFVKMTTVVIQTII